MRELEKELNEDPRFPAKAIEFEISELPADYKPILQVDLKALVHRNVHKFCGLRCININKGILAYNLEQEPPYKILKKIAFQAVFKNTNW